MELNSGELFTLSADPMLILMAMECETVEDEHELSAITAERESALLAAQAYVRTRFHEITGGDW
jgi:hypothetical protein